MEMCLKIVISTDHQGASDNWLKTPALGCL